MSMPAMPSSSFPGDMRLVSQLNDRVKLPYSEITLSLYPGENLTDEQWLALSQEYLREMGYEHACYAVILNSDKAHSVSLPRSIITSK
jgi:hypothetical protein